MLTSYILCRHIKVFSWAYLHIKLLNTYFQGFFGNGYYFRSRKHSGGGIMLLNISLSPVLPNPVRLLATTKTKLLRQVLMEKEKKQKGGKKKKEGSLSKSPAIWEDGVSRAFRKTHLKISVLAEVCIRMERGKQNKKIWGLVGGGGTVDVQAVFLLVLLWTLMASVLELVMCLDGWR